MTFMTHEEFLDLMQSLDEWIVVDEDFEDDIFPSMT